MTRDQLKLLAAGQYAETQANTTGTIDKREMGLFVEGATFGWDMANKLFSPAHFKKNFGSCSDKGLKPADEAIKDPRN